jgi:hypothetical protein
LILFLHLFFDDVIINNMQLSFMKLPLRHRGLIA